MRPPPITDTELAMTTVLPSREEIFARFRGIVDNATMDMLYKRIAAVAGEEMTVIGIVELFDISIRKLMTQGWRPQGFSYPIFSVNVLMYLSVLINERDREVAKLVVNYWGEEHPEIYERPSSCP